MGAQKTLFPKLPFSTDSVQKAFESGHPTGDEKFYQGKLYAFRYFFGYELPKIEGLVKRLMNTDGLTVDMEEALFSD